VAYRILQHYRVGYKLLLDLSVKLVVVLHAERLNLNHSVTVDGDLYFVDIAVVYLVLC